GAGTAHGRVCTGATGPTRKRGYGCGHGGPGWDAGGVAKLGGARTVFRARKRLWRKPAKWDAAAEKRHDDPGSGFGTGPDYRARGKFFGAALWFDGDLSPVVFRGAGGPQLGDADRSAAQSFAADRICGHV